MFQYFCKRCSSVCVRVCDLECLCVRVSVGVVVKLVTNTKRCGRWQR